MSQLATSARSRSWAHAAADELDPQPDPVEQQLDALDCPGALASYVTGGKEYRGPHLEPIDEAYRDIAAGTLDRVLITMPPRHGKTRRATIFGIPWYLRRFPDRRVIFGTYSGDYANSVGREVRDLIDENNIGIRVRRTSAAADEWLLAGRRGGMISRGVGGGITGRGTDLFIIDDPYKDHEEANSPTHREKVWKWFTTTAYTRLQPGAAVIVIHTRWHDDDLAGRLLKKEPGRWRIINLPALAEDDDPLGRQRGEALWPSAYSAEALQETARLLGPYEFGALYQGRPRPEGGGLFDASRFPLWHRTVNDVGHEVYRAFDKTRGMVDIRLVDCWRFITVDLAASKKTSADFTVIAGWAVAPTGELIMVDQLRERIGKADHFGSLQRLWTRIGGAQYAAVESAQLGHDIVYAAGQAGMPLSELIAGSDKVTRALPAVRKASAGGVWLPADLDGLDELTSELEQFPNGTHDDQVDTLAYAVLELGADRSVLPVAGAQFGRNSDDDFGGLSDADLLALGV